MIKLILEGNPRSTNHIYRSHCKFGHPVVYMSKEGKALKEDYQWQIKSQYHGYMLLRGLKLTVKLYFKTKRIHDIDNFNKLLYDAMSGLVYEDDRQIMKVTTSKHIDPKKPRIEVEIEELKTDL